MKKLSSYIFAKKQVSNEKKFSMQEWSKIAGLNESRHLFGGKDLKARAVSDLQIALDEIQLELENTNCQPYSEPMRRIEEIESKISSSSEKTFFDVAIKVNLIKLKTEIMRCTDIGDLQLRKKISGMVSVAHQKFTKNFSDQ